MNYEAILFDMDGIIVESETAAMEFVRRQMEHLGYPINNSQLQKLIGRGTSDTASMLIELLQLPLSLEECLNILKPELCFQGFIDGSLPAPLIEGFEALAQAFEGRLKYAIASGSPKDVILAHAERYGLGRSFSAFVSADEVGKGKPAPDVYLEAAKRLGVPIGRCIVLDDASPGVLAGKAAGAHTIAVPTEYTRPFDFSAADKICASLNEAQEYIKTLL